jgi:hypothetical protein
MQEMATKPNAEELARDIMDEIEHLHARVDSLEASLWDTVKSAGKSVAKGVTGAVKKTASVVHDVTRTRQLNDHDITEVVHHRFPAARTNTSADPATWTFDIKGVASVLTHAKDADRVDLRVGETPYTFHTCKALDDTLKTLLKPPPKTATVAELQDYASAILRQQARLSEY